MNENIDCVHFHNEAIRNNKERNAIQRRMGELKSQINDLEAEQAELRDHELRDDGGLQGSSPLGGKRRFHSTFGSALQVGQIYSAVRNSQKRSIRIGRIANRIRSLNAEHSKLDADHRRLVEEDRRAAKLAVRAGCQRWYYP